MDDNNNNTGSEPKDEPVKEVVEETPTAEKPIEEVPAEEPKPE